MEWAEKIKIGIDYYNKEVVPLVDKRNFRDAGEELIESLIDIKDGYFKMMEILNMPYTLGSSIVGLIAHFQAFSEFCLEDWQDKNEQYEQIKNIMDKIDERIPFVELQIDSFLK